MKHTEKRVGGGGVAGEAHLIKEDIQMAKKHVKNALHHMSSGKDKLNQQ